MQAWKILSLALILIFGAAVWTGKLADAHKRADKAMHVIEEFSSPQDGKRCTAEAVGRHTVLTATHCMIVNAPDVELDGVQVRILRREDDGHDHTLLVLTNSYFFVFVPPVFAPPSLNELVWFYGNPGPYRDVYRQGFCIEHNAFFSDFAMLAIPGDSGSAIFNNDGQIVGVVSKVNVQAQITRGFSIAFSPEQLKEIN